MEKYIASEPVGEKEYEGYKNYPLEDLMAFLASMKQAGATHIALSPDRDYAVLVEGKVQTEKPKQPCK